MDVFYTANDLQEYLAKLNGKTTGFVPTMGALHNGHMSLIKRAVEQNDIVISSIFVNPTQFDKTRDLNKYPRTLDADVKMLEKQGCSIVYAPTVEDVYPNGDKLKSKYEIGYLETVLEGASRPGHYQGVCQIVERLLRIVKPTRLYLGQKDYQQVMILEQMMNRKGIDTKVEICPIVREEDGLAMSSRNRRLTPEERDAAPLIAQTLHKVKKYFTEYSIEELERWARANINAHHLMDVDYVEIFNTTNLDQVVSKADADHCIILAAVFIGEIRLIDNVLIS